MKLSKNGLEINDQVTIFIGELIHYHLVLHALLAAIDNLPKGAATILTVVLVLLFLKKPLKGD